MAIYVKHKISPQCKLQSKHKLKDPVPAPAVAANVADVAVSEAPSSPVPPSVPSVTPVPVDPSQLSVVKGEILSQVKLLFGSFVQSLEAQFGSIDNRFSQVMSDGLNILRSC